MLRGVFVTGTDTGVGKTVVCAAILHRYRDVVPLRYWKPIQTGIEIDDDTATVVELGACNKGEALEAGERLPRPLSPHLAARLSGRTIDLAAIHGLIEGLIEKQPPAAWIVEGAGGALVPINHSDLMTDLMMRLRLPLLVVARSGLGTINHTLLTLEALRTRSLEVAGVVMVGRPEAENRAAIEHYGGTEVLAEMPLLNPLRAEALRDWARDCFDRLGRLGKIIRG